jgi:hypothetical protein
MPEYYNMAFRDPPPFNASPLVWAKWKERVNPRGLTVSEIWLLRDAEQDERNEDRAKNWAVREKIGVESNETR